MYQIIEQTDEQKKEMYRQLSKEELITILIEANRMIGMYPIVIEPVPDGFRFPVA